MAGNGTLPTTSALREPRWYNYWGWGSGDLLGAGAARLLDEPRHAPGGGIHRSARLDVPEARIGAARHDAHRHEARERHCRLGGTGQRGPELLGVADRPVGVHRDHHRIAAVASDDLVGRPCERRRRSALFSSQR